MSVVLSRVVIHELVKEQHEDIQPSKIKEHTLPVDNETVQTLVDGIVDLYGKKNSSAQYGVFETGEGRGNFPDEFDLYRNELPSDEAFLSLTTRAMTELYGKASNNTPASGGHILFADYVQGGVRYFLSAMVKQKPGYKITGELKVEDLEYIDLSRLHQAAKISFSKYEEFFLASQAEQYDINYLSFVSPRNHNKTAGYFISAFGCKAGSPSAKATQAVVSESQKFFNENEQLAEHSPTISKKLYEYLDDKQHSGDPAKLSEIEKIAREFFPAEDADELAERFVEHLNSDAVAIPNEFSVNKSKLHNMTHIVYKGDEFQLTLDKDDIGQDEDAKFYYDGDRLTITDLPPEFKSMLDEHFK
ncbi:MULTISPECIES: nucleoid-associated protein [Vibrio]|uniref:nucleoid-associated protein n=1 Tax=Vibrio TaxID=662 RepID=UPI001047E892|nr:nucleoid-associated protein [Vibrio crassostreae]CAH7279505.1 conserved hypothetical protein [Vibrio chagasii]TCT53037.1 nucleoid-associated protein [Vibrio crassostreae]CAH7334240.1 conserved hypothetical protein [Vibrio chagasii]CAH7369957.1 conserved hypothetical protein [Vibrio chagasii]CAH7394484.1 conserved hypothetical protein [Vibrio chagasii]